MYITGNNIISSLGFSTEENYNAAKQGISGIKRYDAGTFGLPEPFMASLIDKERLNDAFAEISSENHYTNLEKAAILSVFYANKDAHIDLSNPRTLFVLSSTKGNVDLLDMRNEIKDMRYETRDMRQSDVSNLKSQISNLKSLYLWHTAELIAGFFGNNNTPVVVSNACISGAAAQIVAKRELDSGNYDNVVVVGVDFLSKFIISGFQSFKALSPELCHPFDKNRSGLNLGEAAATMIMTKGTDVARCRDVARNVPTAHNIQSEKNNFRFIAGAVRNDATHISAPSRTGEGSFRALNAILNSQIPNLTSHISSLTSQISNLTSHISNLKSQIAFINAHGTATSYNDAMEMNAIVRAGLQEIPVNALKSCFGHTLGAAGVVETIISMYALNEGLILKTLGFEESEKIVIDDEEFSLDVCKENRKTDKNCFIKMMSGFGGVNVALLYTNS